MTARARGPGSGPLRIGSIVLMEMTPLRYLVVGLKVLHAGRRAIQCGRGVSRSRKAPVGIALGWSPCLYLTSNPGQSPNFRRVLPDFGYLSRGCPRGIRSRMADVQPRGDWQAEASPTMDRPEP